MNYPLISEYIEAIKSAEDNFAELSYLRPVLGDDGLPVMTSGNFAVVFKMKDENSSKYYAVKCFTKEQEGRAEAYREIAKELKDVSSPYLVSIRYLEKELFVDTDQTTETEFPILLMDWVEGKTLDKYLRENIDDKYALEMLAYRFSQLAQWLIPQPFAHGDLKPDNIIAREDGTLVLVDYDGMYVPAMKGQKARELGSPDFRHPQRTENDFDEHIDDFPAISILLSLKVISLNSFFLEKYGATDRLLLSEKNYCEISQCNLLKELYPSDDTELGILLSLFNLAIAKSNLSDVSIKLLSISRPKEHECDFLSTEVTENDYKIIWEDKYGATYSPDGKRLLGFYSFDYDTKRYQIRAGTLVICDLAFKNYDKDNHYLEEVYIPSSVRVIGVNPFAGCIGLSIMCDSPFFKVEEGILYTHDYSCLISCTKSICETLELYYSEVRTIGSYALSFCQAKRIILPYGLWTIEEYAFSYSDIKCLMIPGDVKKIGKCAFEGCKFLTDVFFDSPFIDIDISSFEGCTNLRHIIVYNGCGASYKSKLPNFANKIWEISEYWNFEYGLDRSEIAMEIFELGKSCWEGKDVEKDLNEAISLYEFAYELGNEEAGEELKSWGNYWFDENKALYSNSRETFEGVLSGVYNSDYEIKGGTKYIADGACSDSSFRKLTIPKSVISIGDNPFGYGMREVVCLSPFFEIDNGTLYSKGKKELIQCYNPKKGEFIIPEGVEVIRTFAFVSCRLKKIVIPNSVREIQKNPFAGTGVFEKGCYFKLDVISNSPFFTINNNALYKGNKLISYWGTYDFLEIPSGVENIGDHAICGEGARMIRTIKLPASINAVAEDSIYGTERLKKVIVPLGEILRFRNLLPQYIDIIVEETI